MLDRKEELTLSERTGLSGVERYCGQSAMSVCHTCGYLCDVEGNWDHFKRYVEVSKVLRWSRKDELTVELNEGCIFVFGGDSVDKGIGDIRC